MTQPKKDYKAQFIVIGLGLIIFTAWKFTLYFCIGLALLIGIAVFLYIKVPNFRAWINSKLHLNNGLGTAKQRQGNGTPGQVINIRELPSCNKPGCGGKLEPITNWPKFMLCDKCGKVQQRI